VTALSTVAAATINSLAAVVEQIPVSASVPLPALLIPVSSGAFGSRPLYSKYLTSGLAAPRLKVTVIVLHAGAQVALSPLMFFA